MPICLARQAYRRAQSIVGAALRCGFVSMGVVPERIKPTSICARCAMPVSVLLVSRFGGTCGRHGAFAARILDRKKFLWLRWNNVGNLSKNLLRRRARLWVVPGVSARVIGVSKTVGLDAVAEAIEAGIHDSGKNRPG